MSYFFCGCVHNMEDYIIIGLAVVVVLIVVGIMYMVWRRKPYSKPPSPSSSPSPSPSPSPPSPPPPQQSQPTTKDILNALAAQKSPTVFGRIVGLSRVPATPGRGIKNAVAVDEIRVYGPDNKEIIPETIASSQVLDDKHAPGNVMSGVPGAVHTIGGDDKNWITLDLGSDKEISKIVVVNDSYKFASGLSLFILDSRGMTVRSSQIKTELPLYTFMTNAWPDEV